MIQRRTFALAAVATAVAALALGAQAQGVI